MFTNPDHAVFLIDDRVRAVSVSYDKIEDIAGRTIPRQTLTFKTFDQSIKVGDFVVIPTDTRWNMTVGRVEAVDVRVNYSSNEKLRWVMARIPLDDYKKLVADEQTLIVGVAQAEEAEAREQLAAKLKKLNPDLKGLQLLGNRVEAPAPARPGGDEPQRRGGAQNFDPPVEF